MAIVLKNALLADFDPIGVAAGELRIDGGRIAARGTRVDHQPGDDVVDCGGAVVLPGLVNGHAHLYSALATGMPAPRKTPQNFPQILEYVWWRLDRALDARSIEMSAKIGGLDALRCGTTTLIDHHASPNCIDNSLDYIEAGLAEVGLRAVQCYETTDRNGLAGRTAGIEENRRYLAKCSHGTDGRFAGLVGAHASFTLEDETLDELAAVADDFETGVHIHVAEDTADEEQCQSRYQLFLMDRLAARNILRPQSVFAHGTHLDAEAIDRLGSRGVTLAHNPRSNMNNGVGYTPIGAFRCPIMLGTDGIGSDMFTEAKHAWFKACDEHAGVSPGRIIGMLAMSARRASEALRVTLGKLAVGAAADVVLTDYRPATELTSENLPGHFLYSMGSQHVASVMVAGKWLLRDRVVKSCDEPAIRRASVDVARRMWDRMATIE